MTAEETEMIARALWEAMRPHPGMPEGTTWKDIARSDAATRWRDMASVVGASIHTQAYDKGSRDGFVAAHGEFRAKFLKDVQSAVECAVAETLERYNDYKALQP